MNLYRSLFIKMSIQRIARRHSQKSLYIRTIQIRIYQHNSPTSLCDLNSEIHSETTFSAPPFYRHLQH